MPSILLPHNCLTTLDIDFLDYIDAFKNNGGRVYLSLAVILFVYYVYI